jgi:hypothetical protein
LDKENGHSNKNGRRTWTQIHINTTASQLVTVRSLIFEGEEELMPDCVRFQGDCGDPKIITV